MSTPLVDANVLIALVVTDHEHHGRVTRWVNGTDAFAVCPIVEGALVRFLVRAGESGATAAAVVRALRASPLCDFWPDALSYADAELGHVVGHRQVTDAYLVSLAQQHGARLATFDEALARTHATGALLVPES